MDGDGVFEGKYSTSGTIVLKNKFIGSLKADQTIIDTDGTFEGELKTEELIIDQIDDLPTIKSCKKDSEAHNERLSEIEKKYSLRTIWRKF